MRSTWSQTVAVGEIQGQVSERASTKESGIAASGEILKRGHDSAHLEAQPDLAASAEQIHARPMERTEAGAGQPKAWAAARDSSDCAHILLFTFARSHANEDLMPRNVVFTANAAKPPATYSQAVKAGGLVFVSGTAPIDPATGTISGTTVQEQTRMCLQNITAILSAAGSSLDKIVSVTVVLADEDDFAGMNEEYATWFPSSPPARQGAKLPVRIPGLKVSIAAIAEA